MNVIELVESTLQGMGYELVDFEQSGRGLLRVFMDSPAGISVEDCERVSHQLTRLFMVEGVDYDRLEVSSPGLDRVIKKEADFIRFAGKKIQVRLSMPVNGRKKFVGVLGALQDGQIHLACEEGAVSIALDNIDKARLVPEF